MDTQRLTLKKRELDQFRPLPPELVANLEAWFKIELTYTSNALEGNTLTRQETAAVVEKGLTVRGKPLKEHLEAINHADALQNIQALIKKRKKLITLDDILLIHETILRGIDEENAGYYRNVAARISGSQVILPSPVKVPKLMNDFGSWLSSEGKKLHPAELATVAHYRLVTIHPFVDGNGRTARLMMNLILMQHGYPPAVIRTRDRIKYLTSLEQAQLGGSIEDYRQLIFAAIDRSLDIYLKAVNQDEEQETPVASTTKPLLKIGQLAKRTGESNATIRYWTKEGLLHVTATSQGGYLLYAEEMIARVQQIRTLQQQRLTLTEIKEELKKQTEA